MVVRAWLLALLTLFTPALAREAVVHFESTLELHSGGHLSVTEDLTVRIEHNQVRHGIYRDLLSRPLGSLEPGSGSIRYRIEAVLLDGRPAPWRVERRAQGVRVYVGSQDALAPLGEHRYTLRYRASYASRRDGQEGRLVWNVTGNDWALPIEHTTLRLRLPPALAGAAKARVLYGPLGSTSQVEGVHKGDELIFQYDQSLPPGSGLTLELVWPLALLPVQTAPPDPLVLVLAGVLLLLTLFLLVAWNLQGRDPRPGAVIPRFRPPQGVSAVVAAYLADRNPGSPRVFTAALAELAAKGYVEVTSGPPPRISRTAKTPDERLATELRALLEALLPEKGSQIELSPANAKTLERARSELGRALRQKVAPYLRSNTTASLTAGAVAVLTLGAVVAYLSGGFAPGAFAAMASLFYLVLGAAALHSAALAWSRYRLVPGLGPLGELLRAAALLLFVSGVPLAAGLFLALTAGAAAGVLAAAILLAAAWGLYLLPALTPKGAELWRHLQGLARYLGTTDAAALRRIGAPEDTPETLRALYPYAIALGIESRFARRLARYLQAHPQKSGQALLWAADGRGAGGEHLAGFSTGVSRALQAAYVRATASRSGSGGGSFSGGGSGGGGGGGW